MAENKEFYLVIKGEKIIVSEEVYLCKWGMSSKVCKLF